MSKPLLRHQFICLKSIFKILLVNSERNSHQHVLRALNHLLVDSHQVRLALKRLEPEKVIIEISREVDLLLDFLFILRNYFENFVREERAVLA